MQTPRRPLGQLRRALLIAAVFSAFSAASLLVVPLFALQLLETALPAGSVELLFTLLAIAGTALLVAGVIDTSRELTLVRAGVWIDHKAQPLVIEHGLARGLDGQTLKALAADVGLIRRALAGGSLPALLELPWLLAACGLVALLHPHLAIACGAAVLLPLLLCLTGLRRSSLPERGASSAWLDQIASRATQLASTGAPAGVARKWEQLDRKQVGPAYASLRYRGTSRAVIRLLASAGIVGLTAFGGYLVVSEALLPGAVVAAVLLLMRIAAAIEQVSIGSADISAARAAWRNVEALDLSPASLPSIPVMSAPQWITLDNVTVSHPNSRSPMVRNVTLAIAPGECIGVIGARSSGKSTLLATIAGQLLRTAGKAAFGNTAIGPVQRRGDRRAIGYMSDTAMLIAGSVSENISGFEPAAGEQAILAAKRAGVHEIILALPQGYSTEVGLDGSGLPMRIRRSIALARALYGSPLAVVLDEPELGLDAPERSRLAGILDAVRKEGITLVVATGDPTLLRLTDRVVVMSDGAIEGVLPSQQISHVRASPERQVA